MNNQQPNLKDEKKKILPTILCAALFAIVMLTINWMVVPQIINLVVKVDFIGPFAFATEFSHLVLDLILASMVAFWMMYYTNTIKALHGKSITLFMAFCGWSIYFIEVGFFKGMINSIYPLWYEILSFLKYPTAATLAVYVIKTEAIETQNKTI